MGLDDERRAFEMLCFNPYSLPAEFDWELAALGYYSKSQKERSDLALTAFDKEHPYESSSELLAFKELEFLGIYSPNDFYSPSKAKRGFYTARLKQHRSISAGNRGPSKATKTASRSRRPRYQGFGK